MPYWDARFSGRPNILVRFHANQGNQNYGANTSEVNVAVEIIETAQQPSWSFYSQDNTWAMNIAGQNRSGNFTFDFRPSGLQSWYIWSGTVTVTHDGDGHGYVSIGGSAHSDVLGDLGIGSQGFWLSRIPKTPREPSIFEVVDIGTNSFGVRYGHPDDRGSAIVQDHAQWSTDSGFSSIVWEDYDAFGYTNPRGNGNGPGPLLSSNTRHYVRIRSRNAIGWGPWSATASATTLGQPGAPTGVTLTPSGSVAGRVTVSWTAPSVAGQGGITGYTIYRGGVRVGTTTGTGTSFVDNSLTPYTTYAYAVAARNAYSDSTGTTGPKSSSSTVIAAGPPTAPRNLTAVSNSSVSGRIDLSWTAPSASGTGVTNYRVYRSEGTLVAQLSPSTLSYSVTNLTPGSSYSFYVTATNDLSDNAGTESAASNTATASPVGEPTAPTGVTLTSSTVIANRLTLSWSFSAGGNSGFNIFRRTNSGDTLIQSVGPDVRSYPMDNLTAGTTYSFYIRARTVYTDSLPTDGYPGNYGGKASSVVSATPGADSTQTVPTLEVVSSNTNAIFAGSYTLNSVTSTSMSYRKVNANIPQTVSGGTAVNTTNTTYNGTYSITATTSTTFSYAKTASDIGSLGATGTVTDNTNVGMSGTFTVSSVNVGANLLSYNNTGSDVTSTAVPVNAAPGAFSKITNKSNAVFNATGKTILSSTADTLTYAQIASDVAENSAAGVVTNTTNRDTFNGVYTVTSVPEYNIVRYSRTAASVPTRTTQDFNGVVYRTVSPATLSLHFRSGWAG